jgi:hypothetical protein
MYYQFHSTHEGHGEEGLCKHPNKKLENNYFSENSTIIIILSPIFRDLKMN